MAYLNENYLKLHAGYLFPEIARRVNVFCDAHPKSAHRLIRCGIGDVTEPLPGAVIEALHRAVDEMAVRASFRGYGPEQGYDFLRGAIAQNERANLRHVEPTMKRRAELVLSIASSHRVDRLVLGAWGCGVFRNDPRTVAGIFAETLKSPGKFGGVFGEVVFAVFDRSENEATYRAFADQIAGGGL